MILNIVFLQYTNYFNIIASVRFWFVSYKIQYDIMASIPPRYVPNRLIRHPIHYLFFCFCFEYWWKLYLVIALNDMVLTCLDKRRAKFGEFKGRSSQVDWSQRPLPLTILNVQKNPDMSQFIRPEPTRPSYAYPLRTTYNSWPDDV